MTEEFRHNAEDDRFEAWIDGAYVGEATYALDGDIAAFDHTYVDPVYRSTGVAGRLVQHSFDEIRAAGEWKIRPVCPFVESWLRLHPEYQDLIA